MPWAIHEGPRVVRNILSQDCAVAVIESWQIVEVKRYCESMEQGPVPPSIAATVVELMGTLRGRWTPFPMDNYDHSLQTATRAMRAGADTDLVVAALLHDVGKSIAAVHHGNVAASMLNGLVRPEVVWVVRVHQAFTARVRLVKKSIRRNVIAQ